MDLSYKILPEDSSKGDPATPSVIRPPTTQSPGCYGLWCSVVYKDRNNCNKVVTDRDLLSVVGYGSCRFDFRCIIIPYRVLTNLTGLSTCVDTTWAQYVVREVRRRCIG